MFQKMTIQTANTQLMAQNATAAALRRELERRLTKLRHRTRALFIQNNSLQLITVLFFNFSEYLVNAWWMCGGQAVAVGQVTRQESRRAGCA